MLGSETAETNLRTMLLPCYLQLLGVDVGERDCGDESADAAVTMLFAAVGDRCWGARLRRRICGRCCNEIILGHDVRIKVVFDYECPLLEPRILTNPHMIQTGHIWFFQLAVCFWVLGLPLLKFRCGKLARRCSEKRIFKSKC